LTACSNKGGLVNRQRERAVDAYLDRLERALEGLPAGRREEIVEGIGEHIDSLLGPDPTDAEVLTVLDRVGDPEQIAADAREDFGITAVVPKWTDSLVPILMPLGGIVLPVIGWIIGAVWLWNSPIWTRRDKLIGTLVVPGGLLLPFFVFQVLIGTGGSTESTLTDDIGAPPPPDDGTGLGAWLVVAALLLMVVASIGSAIRLGRRLGEARRQAAPSSGPTS
jgi:HAAS